MENVNVVIVDDNPMILNTLDEVISSDQPLFLCCCEIDCTEKTIEM